MTNSLEREKDIEQIRKQLRAVACQPPNTDPFSREGSQAWQDWSELCRGYEAALRDEGVQL